MKRKLLLILLTGALMALALLVTSCSSDLSPYKGYNDTGYTVSVRYDANGGVFTTNTEIIMDSYDISKYKENAEGKKEIKLFAPEDGTRGNQAYQAERVDYYLAGWYTQRTEVVGENGETEYAYSGRWDFAADTLALDADKEYSADEPVITLYAAWVPAFQYEFYTLNETGDAELISTTTVNPTGDTSIRLPSLNAATGQIGFANDFPNLTDKTYDKIYADAAKTSEITGTVLQHSGKFDSATAKLENPVMKIYCTTLDGLWFEVDSADKIAQNSYLNAHYILKNDIDFTNSYWPNTFMNRNFEGSIQGNGYTIKNITINQTDNTCVNFGLFGQLTERAALSDVTFENITVNIKAGSRMQAPNFGILAGTVADAADISDVTVKNSKFVFTQKPSLMISTMQNFIPSFGYICGSGSQEGITSENNAVTFAGDGNLEYDYTVDTDGRFTLTKKQTA